MQPSIRRKRRLEDKGAMMHKSRIVTRKLQYGAVKTC